MYNLCLLHSIQAKALPEWKDQMASADAAIADSFSQDMVNVLWICVDDEGATAFSTQLVQYVWLPQ